MFRLPGSICAAALLMAILVPASGRADPSLRDVTWHDLAPGGRDKREYVGNASPLAALVLNLAGDVPAAPRMAADLDGKRIRLSGYVVPVKYAGSSVAEFLLVPYVGACVHVPPPPKNQIVLVTSDAPVKISGLFQAVTVTGTMSVSASKTEVADAGYRLKAMRVSDYEDYRRVKRLPGHAGEASGR